MLAFAEFSIKQVNKMFSQYFGYFPLISDTSQQDSSSSNLSLAEYHRQQTPGLVHALTNSQGWFDTHEYLSDADLNYICNGHLRKLLSEKKIYLSSVCHIIQAEEAIKAAMANLDTHNQVIIPLNISENHYVLAIISEHDETFTLEYVDSLPSMFELHQVRNINLLAGYYFNQRKKVFSETPSAFCSEKQIDEAYLCADWVIATIVFKAGLDKHPLYQFYLKCPIDRQLQYDLRQNTIKLILQEANHQPIFHHLRIAGRIIYRTDNQTPELLKAGILTIRKELASEKERQQKAHQMFKKQLRQMQTSSRSKSAKGGFKRGDILLGICRDLRSCLCILITKCSCCSNAPKENSTAEEEQELTKRKHPK